MKKIRTKEGKRILAFLCAGLMMASLAGCGKDKTQTDASQKDFYYVPEYKDFKADAEYFSAILQNGDELLLVGSKWDEAAEKSNNALFQYDFMTEELQERPLDLPENASVRQSFLNEDGNLVAVVDWYEDSSETDSGEQADNEENAEDDSSAQPEAAAGKKVVTDGSVVTGENDEAVTTDTTDDADGSDEATMADPDEPLDPGFAVGPEVDYTYHTDLYVISSKDGSVLSNVVFDVLDENSYIQYMLTDGNGLIYLMTDQSIEVVSTQGEKKNSIDLGGNWINCAFTAGGKVYVCMWGGNSLEIYQVDSTMKTMGSAIKSDSLNKNFGLNFYEGDGTQVLVSDGTTVFSYDPAEDKAETLFDWLDADINSDDVQDLGRLSDGRYYVLTRAYSGDSSYDASYSMVLLTKTPASEVQQKEEITFGALYTNQDLRKNIIDFNKSSDKYHITVKSYSTDDFTTGLAQFNNDIAGGKGPDIIDISNIDYNQYASMGVFEDLYPYMDKEGMKRSDYLENVFKAYEVEGKLCAVIPQFVISTTMVKDSKISSQGWTLSEMLDFVEQNNAENIFDYGSRSTVFYYCIYNNMNEFMNWETGESYFDGEDFARVLEFAAKFPDDEDINYTTDGDGISAKIRGDKVLLMQTSFDSVQEYQMYNGLFGEKVNFIGYPDVDRKGNMITSTSGSVAINASSKHKDGAWAFVSTLLSDEYQDSLVSENSMSYGFPVKRSALEKQFAKDMEKEYTTDADGNKVEQMKTSWGYDDFEMDIYAATQDEIDAVRAVIESAEKASTSVNEELINIITEETGAFFKGQKSAKETADIIQNRVQIYMKEHS